jgi:hypothetical protein
MTIQNKLKELLEEIGQLTGDFKLLSQVIDKAGRQRMLSQQVMKLFLMQQSNKGLQINIASDLQESLLQFDQSLSELIDFELNSVGISEQLEKVRLLWHHFKSALNNQDVESATDLNNQVLIEMNQAVMLYVELSGKW